MLRTLGKGLLARLLAYAVIGLGFWLLFQGFLRPHVPLGILGGALIPVGMYLLVTFRRGPNLSQDLISDDSTPPDSTPPDITPPLYGEPVDTGPIEKHLVERDPESADPESEDQEEARIDPIHDPFHRSR